MRRLLVLLLGIALLIPVALGAGARGTAAQTAAMKIRVPITDNGFNDQPTNYTITVPQGQLVELTFVWDQKIHVADKHIIVLDGYNIESAEIGAETREATLRFTADKAGSFRMKCDLECEIHNVLKNGTLIVSPAAGPAASPAASPAAGPAASPAAGPAAAGTDTRPKSQLGLSAPVGAALGSRVPLSISAGDASGAPIAGAQLRLVEVTGFYGLDPQEIEVARAVTAKDGTATLEYVARRTGTRVLKATFAGDVTHAPASLDVKLEVGDGPALYHVEPPAGIPGVSRFFVSGIIIAVWGTMFIVAMHVVGIVRASRNEGSEAEDGDA